MRTLAHLTTRHPKSVMALWLLVLVAVIGTWQTVGSSYSTNFSLSGTDSQTANDLLQHAFPQQAGDSDQIVLRARTGSLTRGADKSSTQAMLKRVTALPHVASVSSPYAKGGSDQISRDGKIAFATVLFDQSATKLTTASITRVVTSAERSRSDALQVEFGGSAFESIESSGTLSTTGIGLAAAVIVLLFTFGSITAMGLPIVTALFGLGTGIGLVGLSSYVIDMNSIALEVAAMIGLGVGIDYALFILTRFREDYQKNGGNNREAIVQAMDTSGRAVIFAGFTVVIALLGMFLLGVAFLHGLALASALAVFLVLIASITLLPALLVHAGPRVAGTGVFARLLSRRTATRRPRPSFWTRWVSVIQRHSKVSVVVPAVALLALSAPILGIHLGNSDAGNNASSTSSRKAYDLLATGFGPGFNGPLQIVTHQRANTPASATVALREKIASTPGIATVGAARRSADGSIVVLSAYPTTAPQSTATTSLVHHLRKTVIPPLAASSHATIYVAGATATAIDFSSVLSSKLWLFIGVVVALSALLLLVVFRSLLIPLQAAVSNLLTIGASLGIVVLAFQHGWFPGVTPGPIEAFVPVMMFAIVFGLSMDYEVFLVSRIHEEWKNEGESSDAIRTGVGATGRVITAAATVMIVVFGSFILGGSRVLEEFGLGLATAVLLDAFVIRMVLVPAALELFGDRTWRLPHWLDRTLPHISIDGPKDEPAEVPETRVPVAAPS